jgi:hypothetical protein
VWCAVQGLIARSAVDPSETHSGGGEWVPSSVPEYAGWTWKADASNDEVVGHTMAFTVRQRWLSMPTRGRVAPFVAVV